MYQEPMLLEHATAAENIALPLELFGAPKQVTDRNTADLLKRLGLTDSANRLAEKLSSSERSLIAIARAVSTSPMIMIADEPLQHLDNKQSKAVVDLFTAMQKNGTTIVLLSRSTDTARAFGARIVTLKNGALSAESGSPSHGTVNSSNTHRILEETEGKIHQVLETKPARKVGEPKNDKKIKITSIGSGL
jgi:ABC-type ATPase involved in cell division